MGANASRRLHVNIFNITRAGNIASNFWEDVRQPPVLVLWTGWGELSEKYLDTSSPVRSQNSQPTSLSCLTSVNSTTLVLVQEVLGDPFMFISNFIV